MARLTALKPRLSALVTQRIPAGEKVERMRGRKLQEFRAWYLEQHPLCEICSTTDRPVIATDVDHRVALVNGGKDFNEDAGQAQALCSSCHKDKTNRDLGRKAKPQIGHDGWPE